MLLWGHMEVPRIFEAPNMSLCSPDHHPCCELSSHPCNLLVLDNTALWEPRAAKSGQQMSIPESQFPSPDADLLGSRSSPPLTPLPPRSAVGTEQWQPCPAEGALAEASGWKSPQNALGNQLQKSWENSKFKLKAVPMRIFLQIQHLIEERWRAQWKPPTLCRESLPHCP